MLTWIFGGASIIGLGLQILGVFSKYEKTRNAISLVLFGMFVGTLIGAINPNSVSLNLTAGWFEILLFSIAVVILICLLAAQIREMNRAGELYGIAGLATVLFVLILVFGQAEAPTSRHNLSIEERIEVARFNTDRENYDRAIQNLKIIRSQLNSGDPRRTKVSAEISRLENLQINLD